ncbi:MAG: hypothetical protein IKD69_14880 [Solobacterium sp.]|nr:hypothetical protein [Solobacterium sp.]
MENRMTDEYLQFLSRLEAKEMISYMIKAGADDALIAKIVNQYYGYDTEMTNLLLQELRSEAD